jgi:hypothetical protein
VRRSILISAITVRNWSCPGAPITRQCSHLHGKLRIDIHWLAHVQENPIGGEGRPCMEYGITIHWLLLVSEESHWYNDFIDGEEKTCMGPRIDIHGWR